MKIRKQRPKKTVNMTKEELIDLYLVQKIPAQKIAKMKSVCKNTMYRFMKENGLNKGPEYELMVGTKQSKLFIIRLLRLPSNNLKYFYCKCDCGRERNFKASSVKAGRVKSCGVCVLAKLPRCGNLGGACFNRIILSAKNRNIKFNLTMEKVWELFVKQGEKCALSGVPIILDFNVAKTTASLDRIDSKIGYIEGNIQWVHKDINYMKTDMTETEFFNWIDIIYKFTHNPESRPSLEISEHLVHPTRLE